MDMRIPPLKSKILLESNPLKSRILVRRLAVGAVHGARWRSNSPSDPYAACCLTPPPWPARPHGLPVGRSPRPTQPPPRRLPRPRNATGVEGGGSEPHRLRACVVKVLASGPPKVTRSALTYGMHECMRLFVYGEEGTCDQTRLV